jgi:hypothetical protein
VPRTGRSRHSQIHRAALTTKRLATQGGNQLVGNTPEEFALVIKNDLAKCAKLV